MSASPPPRSRADDQPSVLGDLLYAQTAARAPTEKEWVELVHAVAAGDQRALNTLYERSHRLVFTYAMRIAQNRQTAEELTLDVFHDVWRSASGYDPANGTVLGWIMNQARSRAVDRARFDRRKKRANHQPDEAPPASVPSDSADVFEQREQRGLLNGVWTVLTPDERQAIEAAFFLGLTYPEVAERLGQPLGTVKTRIRAGLAKLRKALTDEASPA